MFLFIFLLPFLFYISSSSDIPNVPLAPNSYLTPNEMSAFATSLRTSAPFLVSNLRIIGRSIEGRDIFAFCVGLSCPEDATGTQTRSSKEGVGSITQSTSALLITALQHAREPAGAIAALHLARDLVHGYLHNNAETIAIMRTRRVWFAPCINPDAYIYNLAHRGQQDLARKNRKQGGCTSPYDAIGVDLNRNYDFAFNLDNEGSSTLPCAEDFRGQGAFSEPETASVRDFVGWLASDGSITVNAGRDGANEAGSNIGNLTLALNWHSFARFINVPYAVRTPAQPQDKLYAGLLSIAGGMSTASGFTYGHPWAGMLYTCNGEASDWMVRRHSVLAFSPEIGPDFKTEPFGLGMWPTEGNMLTTVLSEGIALQKYAVWATGAFVRIFEPSLIFTQDSITIQVENRGSVSSEGSLVISVMHHSAPILLGFKTQAGLISLLGLDGKSMISLPNSPSIKEMIVTPTLVPQCTSDMFSLSIKQTASRRRIETMKMEEPIFSTRALKAISEQRVNMEQDNFLPLENVNLTQNSGPHSRNKRVNLGPIVDKILDPEKGKIYSSFQNRALSDISSEPISSWRGSRLVNENGLAPFSKLTSIQLFTNFNEFNNEPLKDTNGFTSYISVSDSSICIIYGFEPASNINQPSTLKALFTGSSGCLPCAAFRSTPFQSSQIQNSTRPSLFPFPETKSSTGIWQDTTLPSPHVVKRDDTSKMPNNGNSGLGDVSLLVYAVIGLALGAAGTYSILGRYVTISTTTSISSSTLSFQDRPSTVVVNINEEEEEEEGEEENENKSLAK